MFETTNQINNNNSDNNNSDTNIYILYKKWCL